MKPLSMITYFYIIIGLSIFKDVSLTPLSFNLEDIALQKVWESPDASRYQKLKIFLHDIRLKFPFNDAKNPRSAYLAFKPTCDRSDIMEQERAICRIITNHYYFGIGTIIGAVSFSALLNVLITAKPRQRYNIPDVPLGLVEFRPKIREKMKYLDQTQRYFNPFEILNVSKDATKDDVKRAYKMLSLSYHPDKHQHEKDIYVEIFKIISDAKEAANEVIDFLAHMKSETKAKPVARIKQAPLLLGE